MNRSCFRFILASFLVLPTYAQYSLEECPFTDPEEKVKLLKQRLIELDDNNTEKARLQKIIDDLLTQIENLKGPKKFVELIPEQIVAVTIGYWAKGNAHEVFYCVPPIENKAGYTIYGGELSQEIGLNRVTIRHYRTPCHKRGFCDSAGEYCTIKSRTRGCYVNTEWYDWYRTMNVQKSSVYKIDYDTICKSNN